MTSRLSVLPALGVASALLWIAGCGGSDEAPPPTDRPGEEESAFVPPRDTDVLLADLDRDADGALSIGAPTNLTRRPGYDNQPTFLPDGSGLWYTAVDRHSEQADIWRYDFAASTVTPVTQTNPESEYSATPIPGADAVSVVRVEADSTQRLWRVERSGGSEEVLLPDVRPVGYHAWIDETTVALFVLGEPPTLSVGDVRTGRAREVARSVGRSIQRIPDSFDVSYVQRHSEVRSTIMRLFGDGSPPQPIVEAVDGGDFHAWTPDGVLLQASGSAIYAFDPRVDEGWREVADFSELNISLTRLAVSPDGSRIALVAEVAPLDALPG